MLISKKQQEQFNKMTQAALAGQLARLKGMYASFFDESGNLIPSVSLEQLQLFRDKLLEIANTYNSMNMEAQAFNEEAEKVNKKTLETKQELIDFCNRRGYKVPEVFRQLYGIK